MSGVQTCNALSSVLFEESVEMNRKITTLKALCEAQGHPYWEACIDGDDLGLPRRRLVEPEPIEIAAPYVYCGLVQDVHIFGRTFLYSEDSSFVFHSQSYQNHKLQGFEDCAAAFIDRRGPRLFTSTIEPECIFLGGMWTEPSIHGLSHLSYPPNFGHFIFEYLNRLAIFELYGLTSKLPVVVYETVPERWIEFLELLGIGKERLIRVPLVEAPAYRKVWVSSACHYRDTAGKFRFWAGGLHWLRFKLFAAIGGPRIRDRRRLYLGREDARWRKIVNEDEVKQLLAKYGFESLPMSRLSARAQLEAISGADVVVSATGAGAILTHFAPEHCINIVLAPRHVGTGYWGGLGGALILRQVFERLECDLVKSPERRDNSFGVDEVADYVVDVPLLQGAVEAALRRMYESQTRDALKL